MNIFDSHSLATVTRAAKTWRHPTLSSKWPSGHRAIPNRYKYNQQTYHYSYSITNNDFVLKASVIHFRIRGNVLRILRYRSVSLKIERLLFPILLCSLSPCSSHICILLVHPHKDFQASLLLLHITLLRLPMDFWQTTPQHQNYPK